ncbi:MAG: GGDEF domain-containing protein, partial [bacterium]
SDYVFRMGGEEFLVLLPNTNREQAFIRANNWCTRFAAIKIPLENDTVCATFSAGLSIYTANDDSIDTLIDMADKALYKAKESGRNRVECQENALADLATVVDMHAKRKSNAEKTNEAGKVDG